jgi:hypothetical protein
MVNLNRKVNRDESEEEALFGCRAQKALQRMGSAASWVGLTRQTDTKSGAQSQAHERKQLSAKCSTDG